jgi:hypothetical protein
VAEANERFTEIHRLHQEIQARLDERERRDAQREKEREERRAALRAKLAAYGLREVSSDELLASFKRLSDTMDKVLEARRQRHRDGING